jgi:hypothetical protein
MACIGFAVLMIWILVAMFRAVPSASLRNLVRLDLTALFVLTAGIAAALAVARIEPVLGVFFLPFALAFAWLARYFIEDVAAGYRKRSQMRRSESNLAFLNASELESEQGEPIVAELVDSPPAQVEPPAAA